MTLAEFQQLIRQMYLEKDLARGIDGTFMWLMEEVGELATALRNGTQEERSGEFADVLAWLATIANVAGIDLSRGDPGEIRLRLPGLRPVRVHLPGCGEAMRRRCRAGTLPSCSAAKAPVGWVERSEPHQLRYSCRWRHFFFVPRFSAARRPRTRCNGRSSSACAWALAAATRPACGRRSR